MNGRRSVLIVVDNFITRQILCNGLSEFYDIFQGKNSEQAMGILKVNSGKISVVILDIGISKTDSFSFLQLYTRDPDVQSIPVIALTPTNGKEMEEKVLSMGACDFLRKPFKPYTLKHCVENAIKLSEAASFINAMEYDRLTGVYSKEFFYKRTEAILAANPNSSFDLVCVDIERFKLVNDLFGMEEGDNLLKFLAEGIKERVGHLGISGRLGPDTFVSLINHRTNYSKDMFVDTIREINEYPLNITLTLRYGIYEIDDITLPINMMCDRARLAIESIKGKYGVYHSFYDQSFRNRMLLEQTITDNMKQALTEHQFKVYYQPKYDLSTEKIIGAEALVRWQHPENGFMSPDDFIPLFEKNGFITDLDMYVWEEACKKIARIQSLGIKALPISVNVSRVDIYNPNLTDILINLVKKYNLKTKYLHLEITESAYTENSKQLIEVVSVLKKVGFVIEMDDFGTGYSSLNMLNELPIDMLKLDMRFLQNNTGARNNNNILSFIISLAKWMNLEVVAEGVETQEQVIMLRNMDCHYAQGYYYARPMSEIDFEILLQEEKESLQDIDSETQIAQARKIRKNIGHRQQDAQKKTMLIVDDMETNRAILSEFFKDDYNIAEAGNGEEAMKYLLENSKEVELVLLDLLMPIMDGFQTLEQMKNNKSLKDIPVIITSQAGEGSEARAVNLGASDFIGKPYTYEVAAVRVANVIAGARLNQILEKQAMDKTEVITV